MSRVTEGGVELHPEAPVDVDLTLVVLPGHPEDDLAFGLAEALDEPMIAELGVTIHHRGDRTEHLSHGLVELLLTGVAVQDLVEDAGEVVVGHGAPWW